MDIYRETIIPSYLNLALCYLKLESYETVVPVCNQIIGFDKKNTKARYRRGLAYQKLKKVGLELSIV